MHDVSELERKGLPSLFVASDEFREAASVQARALGFEAIGVFVPHPIQDRTDSEVEALADEAFPEVMRRLTDG